jgi:hypothetical protein
VGGWTERLDGCTIFYPRTCLLGRLLLEIGKIGGLFLISCLSYRSSDHELSDSIDRPEVIPLEFIQFHLGTELLFEFHQQATGSGLANNRMMMLVYSRSRA